MPRTEILSSQVGDGQVTRDDLNISEASKAVIAKIIGGDGIGLSSTGADTGTGDVTVSVVAHGDTGNIQVNNADALSSDPYFTWDFTNKALTLQNPASSGSYWQSLMLNNPSDYLSGISFSRGGQSYEWIMGRGGSSSSDQFIIGINGYFNPLELDLSGNATIYNNLTVGGTNMTIRSVTYAFPSSQGSSGQALVNDGSGNLSWNNPTAGAYGSSGEIQFNSSGSLYTNSSLFWDNYNYRLSLGYGSSPSHKFEMYDYYYAVTRYTNAWTGSSNGVVMGLEYSGYNGLFWNLNNSDLVFGTNNTERFRITNDGSFRDYNSNFTVNSSGNITKIKNVSYDFPTYQGSSGQVLVNDGNGNLSWNNPTASAYGSSGEIQFNSSGSLYTNSSLFWDNSNNRLSLGYGSSPSHKFEIYDYYNSQMRFTNGWNSASYGFIVGVEYSGYNGMLWNVYNADVVIGTNNTARYYFTSDGSFRDYNSYFTVNSSGNITKINNVSYGFPSSQGSSNTVLTNDGSGNLSWSSTGGFSPPSAATGWLYNDGSNNYSWSTPSATTPAGSSGDVQINSSGVFGSVTPFADGTYNFDATTSGNVTSLTITNGIITNVTTL